MTRLHQFFTVAGICVLAACSNDPVSQSQRYIANGNKYFDRGKYKEASIMYRRALQKDPKNATGWYHMGLLEVRMGDVGNARGSFIRVTDLAEGSGRFDKDTQDAYAKTVDIDYLALMQSLERGLDAQAKEFRKDLPLRAKALATHFPNTFDTYRAAGLKDWADIISPDTDELAMAANAKRADKGVDSDAAAKIAVRREAITAALDNFEKADKLRPFDPSLGYPLISTLALAGKMPEAQKYAEQMVNSNKADSRVYDFLWKYYMATNHPEQGEAIRKKAVATDPKSELALLKLAQHYFVTKRTPEMAATLDKLTADPKTFHAPYSTVGDFYKSTGDLNTAIAKYEAGLKNDAPNRAIYLKRAAEAYTIENRQPEAEKLIAQAVKENPKDPEAIAMGASVTLNHPKQGDADKVIAQLQPLLSKTSSNELPDQATILHFNLGRAYALKGDPQSLDQARLQFQEVLKIRSDARRVPYIPALRALAELELQRGENPQAIGHATAILQIVPNDVVGHLIRAMGLANMREFDKARQEVDLVLKNRPDSREAKFQLARLDLLQKHYPDAEADFESLIKENDPRGFSGLIEAKVAGGRAAEAIQMLQTEIAKQPNNPGLRAALATLNYNTSHYAEAAAEFRKLLDQNPTAPVNIREQWSVQLGESLRRQGDINGALAALNQAKQIAPRDVTPRLEVGMLLDGIGKSNEARKEYEEVLKMQPDNSIALNNIAYLDADSGTDLDQALGYAQRAQKQNPKDLNIVDTIGLIYFKKDLVDESSRLFSELVSKAPDNATFHLHLAMALYRRGDKPQAKRELDAARRNRPSDREQAQIRDLMSKIG